MLADEDERLRVEMESASSELEATRQAALSDAHDIELPFKLKQGQIEVEEVRLPDRRAVRELESEKGKSREL